MNLIAALIQTLDRPTNTVSVIKVFTLFNADANQMVTVSKTRSLTTSNKVAIKPVNNWASLWPMPMMRAAVWSL